MQVDQDDEAYNNAEINRLIKDFDDAHEAQYYDTRTDTSMETPSTPRTTNISQYHDGDNDDNENDNNNKDNNKHYNNKGTNRVSLGTTPTTTTDTAWTEKAGESEE